MAFLAYYFNWSRDELMDLDHKERRRWCEEASSINKKMSSSSEKKNIFDV